MKTQTLIMIVDDDTLVGRSIDDVLRSHGYRTQLFREPQRALEAFRASPHAYAMAISDYSMPSMTGLELLRSVGNLRSGLPLLLMSALMPARIPENIMTIVKPMRFESLIRVVDMCMETYPNASALEILPNAATWMPPVLPG